MKKIFLFTTLVLFSCSPYLRESTVRSEFYQLNRRCSQGPFVLKTVLTGNRWGENSYLTIYTKRDVKLNYEIQSEAFVRKGSIGDTQLNGFCLTKPEKSQNGPENGGTKDNSENPPPPTNPVTGTVPSNPVTDLLIKISSNPLLSNPQRTWYDNDLKKLRNYRKYQINIFSNRIEDLDTKTAFKKGIEVKVILWSVAPNDLDGAVFEWVHVRYTPSDEKKWIAELERKKNERERKILEGKRRQQEYERGIELARLKRCVIITENGKKWWVCRQFETQEQLAACVSKYEKDCWSRKLKTVTAIEYIPPKIEPYKNPPVVANVAPVKKAPVSKEKVKRKQSVFILDPPLITEKDDPSGPPPAPEVEMKPPKPSPSSVWVDGFHKWYKGKWHWMGGFWRVPKEDIEKNKTVKAPRMPPAALIQKDEIISPVPGAVWSPPYYMWDGEKWFFVKGRWIYPPDKNMKFVPPHWQKTPLGIFFVPGKWVK